MSHRGFLKLQLSYICLIAEVEGSTPEPDYNRTGFWVYLTTPNILVYENYAVYDFSGIVGTVGGSLGLFIGFSFMDFMLMLIKIK